MIANLANLTRAACAERAAALTVSRIEVHLDLSDADTKGATTFSTASTFHFASNTDSTTVDFVGESVDELVVNGQARDAAAAWDGARVSVDGLKTDGDNVVTVRATGRFSRTGEGLHRLEDPVDDLVYCYSHFEPAESRRAYPVFEQPDIKCPWVFTVVAPKSWEVLSNQVAETQDGAVDGPTGAPASKGEDVTTWRFDPTLPLPSYITNVCAGPYHRVDDVWTGKGADGEELMVPLGLLCRQSMAQYFDTDNIFTITKQGLEWFNANFGTSYPWGKYDQIFVPEYNLGAMENPGTVTFTEGYIFREAQPRTRYAGRANTILHEMAHMWFGDLVTMYWWDDLWLKESFAEFMGSHVSTQATEFTDAWVHQLAMRKNGAYADDQMPTTHPIVADIPDLEAAKQNFDAITYCKGAAVLRQLVTYVGIDAFLAGSRRYFKAHAFGNARLDDLLEALEAESGRDLRAWAKQWLQTSGPSVLTSHVKRDGDKVGEITVTQKAVDTITGEQVLRDHRVSVGSYVLRDGRLLEDAQWDEDIEGEESWVVDADGAAAPDLVVTNDEDLTYALTPLDEHSRATVATYLTTLESPLTQLCVWTSLWQEARTGAIPAQEFLTVVAEQGPKITHPSTLTFVTGAADTAVEGLLPADQRPQWRERLWNAYRDVVLSGEAETDAQQIWFEAAVRAASRLESASLTVREILAGTSQVPGVEIGVDRTWALWVALAAQKATTSDELDAVLKGDDTQSGRRQRLRAACAVPTLEAKEDAWNRLTQDTSLTNDEVRAAIDGFRHPSGGEITSRYSSAYFEGLTTWWSSRSGEIATLLVGGLYPGSSEKTRAAGEEWLKNNEDAPGALRRLVMRGHDRVQRELRAQEASAG